MFAYSYGLSFFAGIEPQTLCHSRFHCHKTTTTTTIVEAVAIIEVAAAVVAAAAVKLAVGEGVVPAVVAAFLFVATKTWVRVHITSRGEATA